MTDEAIEQIYDTMTGELLCSKWAKQVDNIYAQGSLCTYLYAEMLEAYQRVVHRLGQPDEDQDVEIIINNLLRIAKEQSCQMFRYGTQFAEYIED